MSKHIVADRITAKLQSEIGMVAKPFPVELRIMETAVPSKGELHFEASLYRKAAPVRDAQRRRKMDAFRSEYNRHVLDEDPSGIVLINACGR